MKTALSNREKIMIFLAAGIVIVYLMSQFLILPLYRSYTEKSEEFDKVSAEKAMIDLEFENEQLTRTAHKNARERVLEIKRLYPELMPNEEVDRILTGLCLKNNLNPVTLGMTGPAAYGEKNRKKSKSSDEDEENQPVVMVVNAAMVVKGDYESLKRLIHEVDRIDHIRIVSASFSNKNANEKGDSPNISVQFEVTMLRDSI